MPKQYMFAFTARPAEFSDGFVTVAYSLRGQYLAHERKLCTLAEAEAYLIAFSAAAPAPHQASARLDNPNDRAPAGYAKACAEHRLRINKEHDAVPAPV
jgi:hypothetical protein